MSKVATRTANVSSTTNGHRRTGAPAAYQTNANSTATGSTTSSNYRGAYSSHAGPSRRVGQTEYRIDEVVRDGVRSEVLTIEDTPPPGVAGPSGSTTTGASSNYASSSSGYGSRTAYGGSVGVGEPSSKKRKSDGAFISDQPYSNHHTSMYPPNTYPNVYQGVGANGYAAHSLPSPQPRYRQAVPAAGPPPKNKRKYDAADSYAHGRDGASARDAYRQKEKEPEEPTKDKEGHFIVRVGNTIGDRGRYRITRQLGQGTFGKVVCAFDSHKGVEVAVKVIRAVPKYCEASKVEIKVLRHLSRSDPGNEFKCIHLLNQFDHNGHPCLVTELLSSSVFDFLKENQYQPFPFGHIQAFAKQLFESVAFLHGLGLIHTDLKPENILLERCDYTEILVKPKKPKRILDDPSIRLIDFGSATFDTEYHANVVSTRHYRAPEIILGTGWSYPCDVWSIGCILIEFYTGEALFQTHENLEHLAMMEKVFGTIPPKLVEKVYANGANTAAQQFFRPVSKGSRRRELDFPNSTTSKQSAKFVKAMRPLSVTIPGVDVAFTRFRDLLGQLLQWDADRRITVKEALKHDFFDIKINDQEVGQAAKILAANAGRR